MRHVLKLITHMAKKSHKKDVLHSFIRLQLLQVAVAAAGCQKIIAMREVCFCENLLRSSCQRSVMLHFFAKGQLSFTIFPFFLNLFCQWESSIFQFNILLKIKHEYFFLQLNFVLCLPIKLVVGFLPKHLFKSLFERSKPKLVQFS